MQEFELTDEHLKLVKHLVLSTDDEGHVGVDPRFPFGNDDPVEDIMEILDLRGDSQDCLEEAFYLYADMEEVLTIFLHFATIEPGVFRAPNHSSKWERV